MKVNIASVSQLAETFVQSLNGLFKQSGSTIEEIFFFKGSEGKTHINVKANHKDPITGKDLYWVCVLPINDESLKIGKPFDDSE